MASAKIEAQRRPGRGRAGPRRIGSGRSDTSRASACLVHAVQREVKPVGGMCAARGRRHAGVLACVAGRGAGAEVQGLIRRAVLGGQCVPSRGVCQPMRELPHFRSSVVCAARRTRRPKEGGCWPLGWILSTFSSRAAAVRARSARAMFVGSGRGEAGAGRGRGGERLRAPQPMASLAELRISSSAQLGSALSSALP